jgi:hypothetical protein
MSADRPNEIDIGGYPIGRYPPHDLIAADISRELDIG